MKRIVISICIIAMIIAVGCSAIVYIDAHNNKLYGMLDLVLDGYARDDDIREELFQLKQYFEDYEKDLSAIVNEDILSEMSASVARLMPMLEADSDEFTAECETIRSHAQKIQKSEIPTWYRIL